MKIDLRIIAVFVFAIMLALPFRQARAVEPVPGNSCTGTPGIITNSWQWAGAPENGGVFNGMFCNGSTWSGVINFQSSGKVGIGTAAPLDVVSIGTAPVASNTRALLNLSNTALSSGSANGTDIGRQPGFVHR